MPIPTAILNQFPKLTEDEMRRLLTPPTGPVRMILDTDTHNEIDDQFALAWALLSPEKIKFEGVTTEPYSFEHYQPGLLAAHKILQSGGPRSVAEEEAVAPFRSWVEGLLAAGTDPHDVVFVPPDEGMELSYQEILTVYEKLEIDPGDSIYRGSPGYLTSFDAPIKSASAEQIIERALVDSDQPLYVCAIGCATNVASALLLEPEIIKNMVVVWTSGWPSQCQQSNMASLNANQDPLASQLLFECGVAQVYLPGFHIGAQLRLSLPEMEAWVRGKGKMGDYLYHLYTNNPIYAQRGINGHFGRSWVIWDIINIAWLLNPDWVPSALLPSPSLDDGLFWQHSEGRHLMREAFTVNRDAIFRDFFEKLGNAA